jgi:hypothetical protein
MTMRVTTVCLVLLAALADSAGWHDLGYVALVGAVPAAAIAALLGFGDLLEERGHQPAEHVQALLQAAALGLILLAAAVRAPLLNQEGIPALGITAVVACLVVFAVQVLLAGWVALPRERLRASLRGR